MVRKRRANLPKRPQRRKEKNNTMAEENKEQTEEKQEKKENKFSKFFKKVGKSISDSNREDRLARAYREMKGVEEFNVYTDSESLFSTHNYYGVLDEANHEVTLYGDIKEEDIPFSSILSTIGDGEKVLPRRFYLLEKKSGTVDIELEEKDDNDKTVKNTYSRPTSIYTIDADVQEVKVIKVKNTYYLKKSK